MRLLTNLWFGLLAPGCVRIAEVLLHNYTVHPYADPPITDVPYNATLSVNSGDVRVHAIPRATALPLMSVSGNQTLVVAKLRLLSAFNWC